LDEPQPLRTAYLEAMLEDPSLGLEGFLRQVAAGRYGPRERAEILEFLRGVERDIVGSIHTKAASSGATPEEVERLVEERRQHLAELAARYAGAAPPG
jgi:hypothetical protein